MLVFCDDCVQYGLRCRQEIQRPMDSKPEDLERRLSAILAADVVGYSSLIENNEESTIKAVKALWQNVLEPTARREGGRIVKTMGDGVLAEFSSAVRAVKCALNVQEATAAGDTAFPDGISLVLRIGLHLGDIVIDGDDILGDGVNLAARLEALAKPGGVCISSSVWDQLTADLAGQFQDSGEQTVKNISRPIRTFAFAGNSAPTRPVSGSSSGASRKPTLAIGKFEALTQDETSKVFASGCQQTTAAYLSTLTGLTLVSQNAVPDYLADASFQLIGERYRCNIKLLEGRDEKPVLSNRFDGTLEDLFEAQDALSNRIATSIRYAVNENEGDKAALAHTTRATLEQNLSRAGTFMMGPDPAGWKEAGQLLDTYLEARPDAFMALAMKACRLLEEGVCGVEFLSETNAQQAKALLTRARQLNEQSDFLHLIRAEYHWSVDGNLGEAMRAVDRSLDVTPDYILALNARARFYTFADRLEEARELFEQVIPVLSQNRIIHRILAGKSMYQIASKDMSGALATAQKSLDHAPNYPHSLALAAATASAQGETDLAAGFMRNLLKVKPHLTLRSVRPIGFADPETEERFRAGLTAAGLPSG